MKNKGFTFIELIIALTIFSIIALGIYSTFSTGLIAWRRGEGIGRLEQEARFILDKISKELRSAVAQGELFSGEKNKISFLTLVYNPSTQESEIKRVTYSLGIGQYGEVYKTQIGTSGEAPDEITAHYQSTETVLNSLKRQEETLLQAAQLNQEGEITPEILTNSVKAQGLLFTYAFVSAENPDTVIWQDSWSDNSKLPRGIKVTLVLQNSKNSKEKTSFIKTIFLERGELGQE